MNPTTTLNECIGNKLTGDLAEMQTAVVEVREESGWLVSQYVQSELLFLMARTIPPPPPNNI